MSWKRVGAVLLVLVGVTAANLYNDVLVDRQLSLAWAITLDVLTTLIALLLLVLIVVVTAKGSASKHHHVPSIGHDDGAVMGLVRICGAIAKFFYPRYGHCPHCWCPWVVVKPYHLPVPGLFDDQGATLMATCETCWKKRLTPQSRFMYAMLRYTETLANGSFDAAGVLSRFQVVEPNDVALIMESVLGSDDREQEITQGPRAAD
jgi:hypothetical protein